MKILTMLTMLLLIPFVSIHGQSKEQKKEEKPAKREDRQKMRDERSSTDFTRYTTIYEAIEDLLPGAQAVRLDNRRKGFILRGNTSVSNENFALYSINGILTDDIQTIELSDVERIYQLSSSQAAIYGSQASRGIIYIATK